MLTIATIIIKIKITRYNKIDGGGYYDDIRPNFNVDNNGDCDNYDDQIMIMSVKS